MKRRVRWLSGGALLVLVLSACSWAATGTAKDLTPTSARLTGRVANTVAGTTDWWFEFGPTTDYGSSTPRASVEIPDASTSLPVSATVSSLDPRTYHYRLCTRGADNVGICGADAWFWPNGTGRVSGAGDVVNLGFAQISASVAANSTDSDGAGGGFAAIIPSVLSPHLSDNGPVTCLNVIGNRATVGFVGSNGVDGEPYPRLLFIEDNGPTGDLIGFGTMAEPYTKCPPPTSDSFILPNGFPGLLTTGNFTVQPGPGA